jgi:hypothetical protein
MINFAQIGEFKKTEGFFKRLLNSDHKRILNKYGREGVAALAVATPKDSGLTADSWDYTIINSKNYMIITWTNSHVHKGLPIAILLQYGHGLPGGHFVQGVDYINPALVPIFDSMAKEIWKEVKP